MIQRRRRQGKNQAFEQINITPFTDVLLVLLIIFMIAGSTMVPTGSELQGLAEEGGAVAAPDQTSVTVRLAVNGSVRFERDGERLEQSEISALARSTSMTLLADPEATAETVVREYERLRALGFSKVGWGPPAPSSNGEI